MTPDDKVKDDSASNKPAAIELKGRVGANAPMVLIGLIVTAAVMIGILVNSERVETIKTTPPVLTTTRIVSSQDLEAYTLLNQNHLVVLRAKNDTSDGGLNTLVGRYLLSKVTLGTEVKPDMMAPAEAKGLLDKAVAVTIPATATSSLGGQLRVGDMVDVLLVPANQSAANQLDKSKLQPFENLLVLNLPVKKVDEKSPAELAAITLALPTDKRDDFASALPGATIVLTHKVPVRQ